MNGGLNNQAALQRPRSKLAHSQVLDAAIELFAERGIEGASIDSIAALSGVSKATIYKHWKDKTALALEALGRVHGLDREQPRFASGDLKKDLADFLKHKPPEELSTLRDRLMPHLIAYAARNPEFGKVWRSHVMGPTRATALELMDRGIAQGDFPRDLDKPLALAMLIGPMMYRHIFHNASPAPENLPEGVAQAFWRAFSIPSRSPARIRAHRPSPRTKSS